MKTSLNQKKLAKPEAKDFSLIKWTGLVVITLLLFIYPYNSSKLFVGYLLMYERSIIGAEIAFFVLLLAGTIYLYKTARLNSWKSIISACVWLLPLTYLISNAGAASVHQSHIMIYISFMLSSIFLLGLYYGDSTKARLLLLYGIQFSGYGVVFYGLANMFGQRYFPDALWYQQEVYRVTAVFQYPNAYAAYLSALFLVGLFLIVQVRLSYLRFIHAFMLVPIWVSFMLTLSRGALVIVPILILLVLPFLKFKQQLLFLLYTCISILASFAILGRTTSTMNAIAPRVLPKAAGGDPNLISVWSKLPLEGWSLIVIAGLISAGVILLLHQLLNERLEARFKAFAATRRSYAVVPVALVVITLAGASLLLASSSIRQLLPGEIADRLENINLNQHSVLERGTFYKDALKISADYPVFGAGGGGWNALYEKYQNNPYSSKQVHSFYLQTLVETGWVGLLVLIGFIACVFYIYIRSYIKDNEEDKSHFAFYIIVVSLLVHSAIDFDMSYIYLAILVFLSLGLMGAAYGERMALPQKIRQDEISGKVWKIGFPIGIALLASIMLIGSWRSYMADSYYRNAISLASDKQHQLKDLIPPLDDAIKYSPSNPEYLLREIDWLNQAFNQTRDQQYLQSISLLVNQLRRSEPYNRDLFLVEFTLDKNLGNTDKALYVLEAGIKTRPWDIEFYERTIWEYAQAGIAEKTTDTTGALKKWKRAQELYDEVIARIDLLKELPTEQLQGRDFSVTPLIRLAIGQIDVEQKNYKEAVDITKPLTKHKLDEKYVANALQVYLDALNAQGKDDKTIRGKLQDFNIKSEK
ncbi:O-antigen ligase family protein [Paenibacillus glycinis]|uniref:O-antigen ligase-related domain-containing protein n=1 Tax=Paenibacillus glycinis TaxID=2697035 RepID=A0ABW9XXW2_9BACL|nr:O-antigen ligase family protein [Paenibacillus glycinis]NBD27563.1 hypothetical protein [Paenibacillus glycinis]